MEVKVGYKYSDAGILPFDWEVKQIKEFAIFTNGKAHEQFIDDNGDFVVVNSKFISSESKVYKTSSKAYSILNEGDVCLVMSDIPNGKALAKCFIIDENSKYTLNQRICSLKSEVTDPRYLFYILNRNKYFLAFDTGTGQTNLKKTEVIVCPVPIPPTKSEQSAIANALSDTDALITSLEKLIEKKRAIKQGAMQQLLKPEEGWIIKKLGEIFEFKQGVQCSVDKQFSSWQSDRQRFIRIIDLTQPEELPRYILDPGPTHHVFPDDLFMVRYGTPGLLGYGFEGVIANNLFRIIPKRKISTHFFLYILDHRNSDISQISSSTTMPALNFTALKELELTYPENIECQINVAQILSDMDEDISASVEKLLKYKLLKQGMMQELLTGKTRLI